MLAAIVNRAMNPTYHEINQTPPDPSDDWKVLELTKAFHFKTQDKKSS